MQIVAISMSELLTTRQIQERLQVDRTTVYRMLADGRLTGIKIGNRWRFCKTKIDELLAEASPTVEPTPAASFTLLPLTCLQGMQSVAAEAIGLGAIVLDAAGRPLTTMSHPCRFCQLVRTSKTGQAACATTYAQLAGQAGNTATPITCHAGLHCLGDAIVIDGMKTAVFIIGQYKTTGAATREQDIQKLARDYDLNPAELAAAAAEIPVLEPTQQQKIIDWLPKLTHTLSEVGQERADLLNRLQHIAAVSAVC